MPYMREHISNLFQRLQSTSVPISSWDFKDQVPLGVWLNGYHHGFTVKPSFNKHRTLQASPNVKSQITPETSPPTLWIVFSSSDSSNSFNLPRSTPSGQLLWARQEQSRLGDINTWVSAQQRLHFNQLYPNINKSANQHHWHYNPQPITIWKALALEQCCQLAIKTNWWLIDRDTW